MKGELPPSGTEIDHRNRIRDDNRIRNLRLLSHNANNLNHGGVRSNNTSGVVGVYRNRVGNWFARIYVNDRLVNLGTYPTREEAAEARRKAEVKYWRVPIEEEA